MVFRRFGVGELHIFESLFCCRYSDSSQASKSSLVFQRAPPAAWMVMGAAFARAVCLAAKSTVTYLWVVLMLQWPNQCAMVLKSTPDRSRWTAVLWRRLWGWMRLDLRAGMIFAAFRTWRRRMRRAPKRVRGWPRWF